MSYDRRHAFEKGVLPYLTDHYLSVAELRERGLARKPGVVLLLVLAKSRGWVDHTFRWNPTTGRPIDTYRRLK